MTHPLHHLHKRNKLEKYPHPVQWKRNLDWIIVIVAIAGPLINIPQITKVYITQNATGLSLLAWTFYVLINIPWFIYGVVHKDKPIIISSSLWALTNIIILIGILMYG